MYIAATPEQVWQALTKPELTEQFWFGYHRRRRQGRRSHDGAGPRRQGVHHDSSWKAIRRAASHTPGSRYTRTYRTRQLSARHSNSRLFKDQTRLTIVHDEFDEGSKMFGMIRKGWPAVLSSMKSFLETGRGLQPSWDDETAKRAAARRRRGDDRCDDVQAEDGLRHLHRGDAARRSGRR